METPGWGDPLAEVTILVQPMETPGWGDPLAEVTILLAPPGAQTCSIDADCPEGYLCKDGLCVRKEAGEFPWIWLLVGGLGAAGAAIILSVLKKEPKNK